MVMKALRQGASGGIAKFILFGVMTMAVAGLVMMDIGGFFRSGGLSDNNVFKVQRENVSIVSFDRDLRRNLAQTQMTPQQAYTMGYVNQLLMGKLQAKVMAHAAHENGIVVSKPFVARQVSQMIMPMVKPGQDPKEVLNQVLRSQGMNEKDIVHEIAEQTSGNLFVSALQSGFSTMNPAIARDLALFQKETRNIEYIAFPNNGVKISEPDDDQIAGLYELRKQSFSEPEMRTFKIIQIKDDQLKNTISVSEEEIKDAYESNIDFYKTDENRVFEQAIVASEDKAKAIAELAKASDLKSAAQKEGRANDYMGEENSNDANLLPEVKDELEKAGKAGDVIGPVESALGWHVIKVKKIEPESVRSLEQARAEITAEIKENRLAEERDTLAGTIEDMLAGGSSLEEINKEVPLDIKSLPAMDRMGRDVQGNDVLASYKDSAKTILENGFLLEQGAASPMVELNNGEMMSVYLETLKPETFKSLESVKAQLKQSWMDEQREVQNRAQAQKLLESIKTGADLDQKSLQKITGLQRDEKKAPLSESAMIELFEADADKPFLIDIDGGVAIANVSSVNIPDTIDTSTQEYKELAEGLEKAFENEGVMQYLSEKQHDYNARINQKLLDRVYGQAPADTQ